MKTEKIQNKGQARLFKNRYLEYLTKTHPLVIWALYFPAIIFLIWRNYSLQQLGITSLLLSCAAGLLSWTLFEYLMHRFVFHWTAQQPALQRFVYLLHGNHHAYPRDKERLFMPPVPGILIASCILALMYLLSGWLGLQAYVLAYFAAFMLGYLLYGSMHYAIHAWAPPFRWMKPLWRNHHLHHYKEEEKGFGVSSTLWDHVFGTMFSEEKKPGNQKTNTGMLFRRNHQRSASSADGG